MPWYIEYTEGARATIVNEGLICLNIVIKYSNV